MGATPRWAVLCTLLAATLALPNTIISRAVSTRCVQPGIFCLDCETLAICVQIGDQFHEYTSSCSPTAYCSQSLKECSNKMSYCYDNNLVTKQTGQKFACQSEGIYPDPYDCNVYHICGDLPDPYEQDYEPDATHVCPIGYAFDPSTLQCILPDTHATCAVDNHPINVQCGGNLEVGALEANPQYYWLCYDFVLRLFKCDDGYTFKASSLICVKEDSTTEAPVPTSAPVCPNTSRQVDPANCYRYIDCSNPNIPKSVSCPFGMYFHKRKLICILGFCPYS